MIFSSALFFATSSVQAATLSLSPSSGNYSSGQTFTVNILLDTKGAAVDGVDILYLNYDPDNLGVVDDNASQSGIQITPGALMPMTLANTASNGKITFSQISAGGTTFTSSGAEILATIHFKVIKAADTRVYFDFVVNGTADTNVASKGKDILTAVTNGNYGPSSQPPSPTPPTQCIESWTCTAWSLCSNRKQARTCIDANKCGTTNKRPVLSQSCTPTPAPTPTPTPALTPTPTPIPTPSATTTSDFFDSVTRYFISNYCEDPGYKYIISEDPENQYGICSFLGIGKCDAMDYYCKCNPEGSVANCKNDSNYECSLPCKNKIYSISGIGFGAALAIIILIFAIRYIYSKKKEKTGVI